MIRTTVVSTSITAVSYDAQSRALEVEYVSGRVYRYLDVPEEVFAWLLKASSKGAFVNRMIRDRYEYTEVPTRFPADDADLMAALQASLAPPQHPRGNRRSTR
jgi:lysyl-tRNA synthetase class 2